MPQEILSVQPGELKFIFEVGKQSSCSLHFINTTDNYVAFKVKTTAPKKYSVRPNTGIILPRGTRDVTVTLQAQPGAPPNMESRDKFLVQSVVFPDGAQQAEIPPDLFNKDSGNEVFGSTLKVVYVSPPQSPRGLDSTAVEEAIPRASGNLDNVDGPIVDVVKRLIEEHEATLQKMRQLQEEKEAALQKIQHLQEEKEAALQKTQWLQEEKEEAFQKNQELQKEITAMAARSGERIITAVQHKPRLGFSFLLLLAVALLGILLGYLFRQTIALMF